MYRNIAIFAQKALKIRSVSIAVQHQYSTFPGKDANEKVVLTDDGLTIVCWHPERQFPYECSRPLPEVSATDESVLNVKSHEAYKVFEPKSEEVIRQELMKITHTTKHKWYPRGRDKFAKDTPPDREYL